MDTESRLNELERKMKLLDDHNHTKVDYKGVDYNNLLNIPTIPAAVTFASGSFVYSGTADVTVAHGLAGIPKVVSNSSPVQFVGGTEYRNVYIKSVDATNITFATLASGVGLNQTVLWWAAY